MAVARAQRTDAPVVGVWWLIIFIFLWLVSTVGLVWLYTEQENLRSIARSKEEESSKIATRAEQQLPWYTIAASSNATMVGVMRQDIESLASLVGGSAESTVAEVRQRTRSMSDKIAADISAMKTSETSGDGEFVLPDPTIFEQENVDLLTAMESLHQGLTSLSEQLSAARRKEAEYRQTVEELRNENDALRKGFDEKIASIQESMVEFENAAKEFRSEVGQRYEGMLTRIDDRDRQYSQSLQEERRRREELQEQYQDTRHRLSELLETMGALKTKPQENITARQPDGLVFEVFPNDDSVYINLGARDRLTMGLEFAVYTAEEGIPADGQSKGRIQVVNIQEMSAECRIIQMFDHERILEGDLIANPVYDKHATISFAVVGLFDLNHDGRWDEGSGGVEALIEGWGGRVVDNVTASVDFLVIGQAPREPDEDRGLTTPEAQEIAAEQQARYDHYFNIFQTAKDFNVPILPQETFVKFLGR
jgi:uncharacterized coiled-coil DUF342 family protein